MAHQPMHINDWIEIDKDYVWYLKEKARIIQEQGIYLHKNFDENNKYILNPIEVKMSSTHSPKMMTHVMNFSIFLSTGYPNVTQPCLNVLKTGYSMKLFKKLS